MAINSNMIEKQKIRVDVAYADFSDILDLFAKNNIVSSGGDTDFIYPHYREVKEKKARGEFKQRTKKLPESWEVLNSLGSIPSYNFPFMRFYLMIDNAYGGQFRMEKITELRNSTNTNSNFPTWLYTPYEYEQLSVILSSSMSLFDVFIKKFKNFLSKFERVKPLRIKTKEEIMEEIRREYRH